MHNEYNLDSTEFNSLKTASKRLFRLISERLNVNTAYVTKRGETAMTVVSSYNEQEEIIPEGYSVEYSGTYCRLIITNDHSVMHTANLEEDEFTKQLEVTSQLKVKGFLGVSLTDTSGKLFGTLCVMDKQEKVFSQDDITYLKSMAEILSYLIELDQTKYNLDFLSVPIVPITKGISILTLQGVVDERRAETVIQQVLQYGANQQINYFIADLSGLKIVDGYFPMILGDLFKSIQLMGIETVVTGVTPAIALQEVANEQLPHFKTVQNLESALDYIGFELVEKE
ncbi:GAF domain-containing protein [Guptibacillus hwajinpoensis]|uniref:GAF domain-containing protein n=1 Tax=Guptibacillus hwajinpoensis TaxID=208199 RepID=UPI001CFDDA48|nr:GAF domain-containing protein [Pseudalkalibacillus hwajinpoensis]